MKRKNIEWFLKVYLLLLIVISLIVIPTEASASTISNSQLSIFTLSIPNPPSGITATDGTLVDRIKITWNLINNAAYYEVYRNIINSTIGAERVGSSTSEKYSDFYADPNILFFYYIKACNSDGCSGFSSSNAGYRALATATKMIVPSKTKTPTKTLGPTKTKTLTKTPAPSKTRTPTKTIVPSKTKTPTKTLTPTITYTPSITPTNTTAPTITETHTATTTWTSTATETATLTETLTATATWTPTATETATATPTPEKFANLAWNAFLGGVNSDTISKVAFDPSGEYLYIIGYSGATWGNPIRSYVGNADAYLAKLKKDGTLVWNTFLGADSQDAAIDLLVDNDGNIIVVGSSALVWGSPIEWNQGSDAFLAKFSPSGNILWNTFSGFGGSDSYESILENASGDIFVCGSKQISWSWTNIVIAKYSKTGQISWVKDFGGPGDDYCSQIKFDLDGNIVLVGTSQSTWGTPIRPFAQNRDTALVKLDQTGSILWNTFLGGPKDDTGISVGINSLNEYYVLGYSTSTRGQPVHEFNGGYDNSISKILPDGSVIWNSFFGGTGVDISSDLVITDSDQLLVCGYSETSWGNPENARTTSIYIQADSYLTLISDDSSILWNTFYGSPEIDNSRSLNLDITMNNLYFVGSSAGSWGQPVRTYSGGGDGVIAKLDVSNLLNYYKPISTDLP